MVVAIISASCPPVRQSSSDRMSPPDELRSSSVGLANGLATGKEGPIARTITFFAWVPVTINPPIGALSPVPTLRRVEIFPRTVGFEPGVALGAAVGVGLAVGVGVGVATGVGLGVGLVPGVGVGVGVPPKLNSFKASILPQPKVLLGIVVPGMPPHVCEVVGCTVVCWRKS